VLLLVASAGCAVSTSPAASVAKSFYAAVADSDWTTACGYLAPETKAALEQSAGTACASALAEEDLADPGPVGKAETFGTMTQVRFAEDTVFLARFRSGWKVMALECAPVTGHPYDCRLEGG
jgi:hypothetical protein